MCLSVCVRARSIAWPWLEKAVVLIYCVIITDSHERGVISSYCYFKVKV